MACDAYDVIDRVLASARGEFAQPTPVEKTGLRLACRVVDMRATDAEIEQLRTDLPPELMRLWQQCRQAVLFCDVDYDQWGLEILDPWSAGEMTRDFCVQRVADALTGDLVIGRFRGDSDLVIIRTDARSPDFGEIVIALPLDQRCDWYVTGLCLSEFLERFLEARGYKFWELASGS